jgi:Icc-related predicted phosphoesterase
MAEVRAAWAAADRDTPMLHVLDNSHVDIGAYRFLGTTLWSDTTGVRIERVIGDYRHIDGGTFTQQESTRLYCENVEWLRAAILASPKPCVVVTHHLPSRECIDPKYISYAAMNRAFYSDLDDLLLDDKVALWLCGHTHSSIDKRIAGTRVVCNPRGYVHADGTCENAAFNPKLVVKLPAPAPADAPQVE